MRNLMRNPVINLFRYLRNYLRGLLPLQNFPLRQFRMRSLPLRGFSRRSPRAAACVSVCRMACGFPLCGPRRAFCCWDVRCFWGRVCDRCRDLVKLRRRLRIMLRQPRLRRHGTRRPPTVLRPIKRLRMRMLLRLAKRLRLRIMGVRRVRYWLGLPPTWRRRFPTPRRTLRKLPAHLVSIRRMQWLMTRRRGK